MLIKKKRRNFGTLATAILVANAFLTTTVVAQEPTPGFNNKIPESVLTPDTVETKLGTLEFFDGIPNEKAAAALFANLDLNRGLQALLNGMPASNFEAGRAGHIALGQKKAEASNAIYFGPKAPEGQENNWIQSVPGKGWNTILRLYGSLEPWFDKIWMPGDPELVE